MIVGDRYNNRRVQNIDKRVQEEHHNENLCIWFFSHFPSQKLHRISILLAHFFVKMNASVSWLKDKNHSLKSKSSHDFEVYKQRLDDEKISKDTYKSSEYSQNHLLNNLQHSYFLQYQHQQTNMKSVPTYPNLILFTMIPLIVGDLYFAYRDYSCSHLPIENAKIGFDLSIWLKISGWTNLAFIILPIINYFLASAPRLLLGYVVFALLYALFRFAWIIVGGVMFWGYLWPNRFCAEALNTYMWVNLIYSIIISLLTCYLQQQSYVGSKQNDNKITY